MLTDSVPPAPVSDPDLRFTPIRVGPYLVRPASSAVQIGDDRSAGLTRFEMGILMQLVKQPGTTVSKEQLAEALYPGVIRPLSNGLEVFVKRIREKIDPNGLYQPVQTLRGQGYRFRNDWQEVMVQRLKEGQQAVA